MPEMTPAELRLAIARAKGWKTPGTIEIITHEMAKDAGDMRLEGREIMWAEWSNCDTGPMPDWPAQIVDAWELIDELDNSRIDWQLSNVVPSSDSIVYEFYIIDSESGAKKAYGCDETAPLAICRAWLAWKGLDNAR